MSRYFEIADGKDTVFYDFKKYHKVQNIGRYILIYGELKW